MKILTNVRSLTFVQDLYTVPILSEVMPVAVDLVMKLWMMKTLAPTEMNVAVGTLVRIRPLF